MTLRGVARTQKVGTINNRKDDAYVVDYCSWG